MLSFNPFMPSEDKVQHNMDTLLEEVTSAIEQVWKNFDWDNIPTFL